MSLVLSIQHKPRWHVWWHMEDGARIWDAKITETPSLTSKNCQTDVKQTLIQREWHKSMITTHTSRKNQAKRLPGSLPLCEMLSQAYTYLEFLEEYQEQPRVLAVSHPNSYMCKVCSLLPQHEPAFQLHSTSLLWMKFQAPPVLFFLFILTDLRHPKTILRCWLKL